MKKTTPKPQRSRIRRRLIGFSVLIGMGMIAFMIFIHQSFSNSLREERKAKTLHLSAAAIGVIQYFYKLELLGQVTSTQAKGYAIKALESATYGKNGYFWINSDDGELLMQPYTPERVGINQIDWADINGRLIFVEFVKTAKTGGGWVAYHWPKPGGNEEYPKISYVSYFEPWGWVLGTGVYLDDMQAHIFKVVTKASGMLFASFLVFVVIAFVVVNYFFRQLGDLAVRDALTNLHTKRFLDEISSSILKKKQRLSDQVLAIVFIDIDFFKKVNDTFGHEWGDKVLKELAVTLQDSARAEDFCIRYGGEEFVVIGFFENEAAVVAFAERIRERASQLIFSNQKTEFSITLSAGIAIHDNAKESFEDTLKRADQKLYQSKRSGRNCVSI